MSLPDIHEWVARVRLPEETEKLVEFWWKLTSLLVIQGVAWEVLKANIRGVHIGEVHTLKELNSPQAPLVQAPL